MHVGVDRISDAVRNAYGRQPSPTPCEIEFPPSPVDLPDAVKNVAFPDGVIPPDVNFPELDFPTGDSQPS